MLTFKTKRVAVYGRRSHRIVATSDERPAPDIADKPPGDDEKPFSSIQQCDRTKQEAHHLIHPVKYSAYRSVSPAPTKPDRPPTARKWGTDTTKRQPLTERRTNVPDTPRKRAEKGKSKLSVGTPQTQRTDVDIIVVDDMGRQFSEERRIIRNSAESINTQRTATLTAMNPRKSTISRNTSRRRRAAQRALICELTSEEEPGGSDDDYVPESHNRHINQAKEVQRRKQENRQFSSQAKQGQTQSAEQDLFDDLKHPPRPVLAKWSKRIVVLSDSDSDSPPDKTQKRTGRDATNTSSRHSARVASRKSISSDQDKGSKTAIRELPGCQLKAEGTHAVGPGRPRPAPLSPAERQKYAAKPILSAAQTEANTHLRYDPRLASAKASKHSETAFSHVPARSRLEVLKICDDDYDESLSIDEELRLALELAEIELDGRASGIGVRTTVHASLHSRHRETDIDTHNERPALRGRRTPTHLRPLLSECGQIVPFDFASLITTFPVDPIVSFSDANFTSGQGYSTFEKVGEASYSEVFGIGNVVLKIIPLLSNDADSSVTWTSSNDPPPVSEAEDVLKEILITRAMGEICKGFIKLLKAYVVQGPYPSSLLALWDGYNRKKGSESVRPDSFSKQQTYAIIVLPNGGPDLEAFSFSKSISTGASVWRQACSIFWQVTRCLAQAEELVHFEHRDLHWGQILVRQTRRKPPPPLLSGLKRYMDDASIGIQCTIIDLGLARIDHGCGDAYWTPFQDEIFDGEGDYQYDVYRMMRECNKNDWRAFTPLTNVMWLHYLLDKLMNHKCIRPPSSTHSTPRGRKSTVSTLQASFVDADAQAYNCLTEVEKILRQILKPHADISRRKTSKRQSVVNSKAMDYQINTLPDMNSAGDIFRFGVAKGWIR